MFFKSNYLKQLGGYINESDNRECKEETYTKAPPALPSLVTLPFPKELFISFIAASSAFC